MNQLATPAYGDHAAKQGLTTDWTDAWLAPASCDVPLSSNVGFDLIAFQRWMKFKEAFSPKFVVDIIRSRDYKVSHCFDPFGGSGTTALTSSFLGLRASTIEVNPFLADLIEAKTSSACSVLLANEFVRVRERVAAIQFADPELPGAPATFLEPGLNGRWVFNREVLARILAYKKAIEEGANAKIAQILRVLLGGILVDVSNVIVNGKGRRYRGGWSSRKVNSADVDMRFSQTVADAIYDVARYKHVERAPVTVLRGDCRERIVEVAEADLAITSPPYPNSFDYTDVYNLELWVLGYLTDSDANRSLRHATLRSHVQVKRERPSEMPSSKLLHQTMRELELVSDRLWNKNIPDMIAGYFEDMAIVLRGVQSALKVGADAVIVVGDSQYAGVHVPVAQIIRELALEFGFEHVHSNPIRVMRVSAQHGGAFGLDETMIELRKR